MKKSMPVIMSILCLCILVAITFHSSIAQESLNNEDVNIKIEGGLGVRITLYNNETTPILDTNCEISIDGTILITEQNFTIEISEFLSKDTIFSRIYAVGFGKINATVEFGELTTSRNGFLIGIFVIFI